MNFFCTEMLSKRFTLYFTTCVSYLVTGMTFNADSVALCPDSCGNNVRASDIDSTAFQSLINTIRLENCNSTTLLDICQSTTVGQCTGIVPKCECLDCTVFLTDLKILPSAVIRSPSLLSNSGMKSLKFERMSKIEPFGPSRSLRGVSPTVPNVDSPAAPNEKVSQQAQLQQCSTLTVFGKNSVTAQRNANGYSPVITNISNATTDGVIFRLRFSRQDPYYTSANGGNTQSASNEQLMLPSRVQVAVMSHSLNLSSSSPMVETPILVFDMFAHSDRFVSARVYASFGGTKGLVSQGVAPAGAYSNETIVPVFCSWKRVRAVEVKCGIALEAVITEFRYSDPMFESTVLGIERYAIGTDARLDSLVSIPVNSSSPLPINFVPLTSIPAEGLWATTWTPMSPGTVRSSLNSLKQKRNLITSAGNTVEQMECQGYQPFTKQNVTCDFGRDSQYLWGYQQTDPKSIIVSDIQGCISLDAFPPAQSTAYKNQNLTWCPTRLSTTTTNNIYQRKDPKTGNANLNWALCTSCKIVYAPTSAPTASPSKPSDVQLVTQAPTSRTTSRPTSTTPPSLKPTTSPTPLPQPLRVEVCESPLAMFAPYKCNPFACNNGSVRCVDDLFKGDACGEPHNLERCEKAGVSLVACPLDDYYTCGNGKCVPVAIGASGCDGNQGVRFSPTYCSFMTQPPANTLAPSTFSNASSVGVDPIVPSLITVFGIILIAGLFVICGVRRKRHLVSSQKSQQVPPQNSSPGNNRRTGSSLSPFSSSMFSGKLPFSPSLKRQINDDCQPAAAATAPIPISDGYRRIPGTHGGGVLGTMTSILPVNSGTVSNATVSENSCSGSSGLHPIPPTLVIPESFVVDPASHLIPPPPPRTPNRQTRSILDSLSPNYSAWSGSPTASSQQQPHVIPTAMIPRGRSHSSFSSYMLSPAETIYDTPTSQGMPFSNGQRGLPSSALSHRMGHRRVRSLSMAMEMRPEDEDDAHMDVEGHIYNTNGTDYHRHRHLHHRYSEQDYYYEEPPYEQQHHQQTVIMKSMGYSSSASSLSSSREHHHHHHHQHDQSLTINHEDIELGEQLGAGGNGRIFRASYNGTPVAVKELYSVMRGGTTEFFREFEALKMLRHPHIIQLFGTYVAPPLEDQGLPRHFIVTELAHESLADRIARLEEPIDLTLAERYATEIASAGAFIHAQQLIHFDIKPQNVLLDMAGTVKICDLGIAKFIQQRSRKNSSPRTNEEDVTPIVDNLDEPIGKVHHSTTTSLQSEVPHVMLNVTGTSNSAAQGTPAYMSPELLSGDDNSKITQKVDVYAFGVMMWEVVHRIHPYPSSWSLVRLFRHVDSGYRPPIDDSKLPENDSTCPLRSVIEMCWDSDPVKRPNFKDVLQLLKRRRTRATSECSAVGMLSSQAPSSASTAALPVTSSSAGQTSNQDGAVAASNSKIDLQSAVEIGVKVLIVLKQQRGGEVESEQTHDEQKQVMGEVLGITSDGLLAVQLDEENYDESRGNRVTSGNETTSLTIVHVKKSDVIRVVHRRKPFAVEAEEDIFFFPADRTIRGLALAHARRKVQEYKRQMMLMNASSQSSSSSSSPPSPTDANKNSAPTLGAEDKRISPSTFSSSAPSSASDLIFPDDDGGFNSNNNQESLFVGSSASSLQAEPVAQSALPQGSAAGDLRLVVTKSTTNSVSKRNSTQPPRFARDHPETTAAKESEKDSSSELLGNTPVVINKDGDEPFQAENEVGIENQEDSGGVPVVPGLAPLRLDLDIKDVLPNDEAEDKFDELANELYISDGVALDTAGGLAKRAKNRKVFKSGRMLLDNTSSKNNRKLYDDHEDDDDDDDPLVNFSTISEDSLVILNELGVGACGMVYKAIHISTLQLVAVKRVNVSDKLKRHQVVRETRIMLANNTTAAQSPIAEHPPTSSQVSHRLGGQSSFRLMAGTTFSPSKSEAALSPGTTTSTSASGATILNNSRSTSASFGASSSSASSFRTSRMLSKGTSFSRRLFASSNSGIASSSSKKSESPSAGDPESNAPPSVGTTPKQHPSIDPLRQMGKRFSSTDSPAILPRRLKSTKSESRLLAIAGNLASTRKVAKEITKVKVSSFACNRIVKLYDAALFSREAFTASSSSSSLVNLAAAAVAFSPSSQLTTLSSKSSSSSSSRGTSLPGGGGETDLALVMEFLDGGSLEDHIKHSGPCTDEVTLSQVAADCVEALHFLEVNRIIHRDIKPANILLSRKGTAKLTDFGVVKEVEEDSVGSEMMGKTFVGTITYMSPERLRGHPYGFVSDVWSFGLTLLAFALGRYPVPRENSKNIFALLEYFERYDVVTSEMESQFSPELTSFFRACLQPLPQSRSSALQLLDHPFIQNHARARMLLRRQNSSPRGDHQQNQALLGLSKEERLLEVQHIAHKVIGKMLMDWVRQQQQQVNNSGAGRSGNIISPPPPPPPSQRPSLLSMHHHHGSTASRRGSFSAMGRSVEFSFSEESFARLAKQLSVSPEEVRVTFEAQIAHFKKSLNLV